MYIYRYLFFTVQTLDEFQGPLDFHGHGSWFVCTMVLMYAHVIPGEILHTTNKLTWV